MKDSVYPVTILMWADSTGGTPIWQDVFQTELTSGFFNILLGSQTPLPSSPMMDRPLWISTSVGDYSESFQRSKLSAVPMAINVVDSAITTSKLADNSITSSKMNMNYVSMIGINGTPVTGIGSYLNIAGGNGVNLSWNAKTSSLTINGTGVPDGGIKTLSVGDVVAFIPWSGGPAHTGTPAGATNLVLHGDPAPPGSGQPTWGPVNLTTDVSGILPFGNGGTNNIPKWVGGTGLANVASGAFSTVAGGDSNTASATFAFVGGGSGNKSAYYAAIGGGQDNYASGYWSFIGAGQSDSVEGTGTGSCAIAAGYRNFITTNIGNQNEHFIGAGEYNVIKPDTAGELFASSIVGGWNNVIYEGPSFIGGGQYNSISQESAAIVSGASNVDSADFGFIGAGWSNSVIAADLYFPPFSDGGASSIVGGGENRTTANFDFVGGGYQNNIGGDFSVIPGGLYLSLGGNSFGFNGDSFNPLDTGAGNAAITDLSAFSHVAYWGNVNMMLGNVDNSARALQFYSPNTHHDYSGAKYSSFQAGSQSGNIVYTLPTVPPDSVGRVLGVSGISGIDISLQWEPGGTGGGGSGLAGWLLTGNSGTSAGPNFLGTIDSMPMEIHVHDGAATSTGGNKRVMRYTEGTTSPNLLGGSSANTIDPGLTGVAILSGGTSLNPNKINRSDSFSVVLGGSGNVIDTSAPYSAILSGQNNHITGDTTLAGYGWHNGFDVIGGGRGNFMGAEVPFRSGFNVIGGGDSNFVGYGCYNNVIAGGKNNLLGSAYGVISGGIGNLLNGPSSLDVIAGGLGNDIGGPLAVNGNANYSTISGGDSNTIGQDASHATIGGGSFNLIDSGSSYASIVGGQNNDISKNAYHSIIGGGQSNTISDSALWSFIGAGQDNLIGPYAFNASILGGYQNTDYALNSVITGGVGDTIEISAGYAYIGGGVGNKVYSGSSAIITGAGNTIDYDYSVIMSGSDNTIEAEHSLIGTGIGNHIGVYGAYGAIIAGLNNYVSGSASVVISGVDDTATDNGMVGTGTGNHSGGPFSFIGTGDTNLITGGGAFASIPGGDHLTAQSYSQTVMGFYNKPAGSSSNAGSARTNGNDPLVIVGNGTSDTTKSDAFTVSNSGYSTAYDTIGSGGAADSLLTMGTPTVMGSTYARNTIIAWGNAIPGAPSGKDSADIGVQIITWDAADSQYNVTLHVNDPNGFPHLFKQGQSSVVASINQGFSGTPGIIAVTSVDATGTFHVRTWPVGSAHPTNTFGFMFQVVAR